MHRSGFGRGGSELLVLKMLCRLESIITACADVRASSPYTVGLLAMCLLAVVYFGNQLADL